LWFFIVFFYTIFIGRKAHGTQNVPQDAFPRQRDLGNDVTTIIWIKCLMIISSLPVNINKSEESLASYYNSTWVANNCTTDLPKALSISLKLWDALFNYYNNCLVHYSAIKDNYYYVMSVIWLWFQPNVYLLVIFVSVPFVSSLLEFSRRKRSLWQRQRKVISLFLSY